MTPEGFCFGLGETVLRPGSNLIVRRRVAIAVSVACTIAALLASAAPAAAYEPGGWSFFQRTPAQPVVESPKLKAINRAARHAKKQKELSKEVRRDSEKLPPGPRH